MNPVVRDRIHSSWSGSLGEKYGYDLSIHFQNELPFRIYGLDVSSRQPHRNDRFFQQAFF